MEEAPAEEAPVEEAPVEVEVASVEANTTDTLADQADVCEYLPVEKSTLWFVGLLGLLLGLIIGAIGALRMFMRNGHKWPTKFRRVVAGPNHHHRLDEQLTADDQDENTEDDSESTEAATAAK